MIVQPRYLNYVISHSFKNYLRAKSGMPKVILSHQAAINNDNVSYVYLYSVKKNIQNDKKMLFCFYGLIVDGEDVGVFSMEQIVKIIMDWETLGHKLINFHIHHLLYTDIRKIEELLDAFQDVPIIFFLHDYYLCCKSYHLLDLNNLYCGAIKLNDENCGKCAYYNESSVFEEKIHKIVNKYFSRAEFISPSESTKNIYIDFWPEIGNKIRVIPHQKFKGSYMGNLSLLESDKPIRVGYMGVPEKYKGWDIWEQVVNENKNNRDYEFFVFNNRKMEYDACMHHVNVEYSSIKQNAMVDAVREKGIDIALFWARVPETYSYTCMEAYAANVYIITNNISGNIQDFIRKNENGIIIDDIQTLLSYFSQSSFLRSRINEFRRLKKPGPLYLIDNDDVCELYREQMNPLREMDRIYQISKPLWSKGIKFLYDHFIQKY